jgi:hypothetical protein
MGDKYALPNLRTYRLETAPSHGISTTRRLKVATNIWRSLIKREQDGMRPLEHLEISRDLVHDRESDIRCCVGALTLI